MVCCINIYIFSWYSACEYGECEKMVLIPSPIAIIIRRERKVCTSFEVQMIKIQLSHNNNNTLQHLYNFNMMMELLQYVF